MVVLGKLMCCSVRATFEMTGKAQRPSVSVAATLDDFFPEEHPARTSGRLSRRLLILR